MSVNRAKLEVTPTQFFMYLKDMDDEVNEFHREDYLLARICQILLDMPSVVWGGKPIGVDVEDLIPKFKTVKPEGEKVSPEEMSRRIAASQAVWMAAVGLSGPAGKTPSRKPPSKVKNAGEGKETPKPQTGKVKLFTPPPRPKPPPRI